MSSNYTPKTLRKVIRDDDLKQLRKDYGHILSEKCGAPYDEVISCIDRIPKELLCDKVLIETYAKKIKHARLSFGNKNLLLPDEMLCDKARIETYTKKIKHTRLFFNDIITLRWVADKLGVAHTAIQDQEKGGFKRISIPYLEGFSLLYQMRPCYFLEPLVSTKEMCEEMPKHEFLKNPIIFFSDMEAKVPAWIVESLYKGEGELFEVNQKLADCFFMVSRLPYDTQKKLRDRLKAIPVIEKLLKKFPFPPVIDEDNLQQSFKSWEIYFEAAYVELEISRLASRYKEMIRIFTALVQTDIKTKEWFIALILDGGFVSNRYSLAKCIADMLSLNK